MNKIITWIRGVLSMMVGQETIKKAVNVDVAVSAEMQNSINLWRNMFKDKPPWLDETTQSIGLASSIAGEIARLVTVEMESSVTGSQRADFIQEDYRKVLEQLRPKVEYAAAVGGLVFKPYVDNGHISVDYVNAGNFFPTAFNNTGEITGAVFVEQLQKGKLYYTRIEYHNMADTEYTVKNLAYLSRDENSLGVKIDLKSIDEWNSLEEETIIKYSNGTRPEFPLFAYFKMPFANTVDENTPLGVSVFSRAVDLIKEADKQYSRTLWEYEGSELAVDASIEIISNGRMPKGKERLFRGLSVDTGQSGDLYEVFSPEIRDISLFNGLNQLLRRVEFNCYLSYGTLSDPQNVDKTAEEIKSSKQRSYSAVCEIQKSLQKALERLVWIMDFYTSLYKLAPTGKYEVGFTWGDGILSDTAAEFLQRKMLVDGGYLKPENLLAWYFGVSEEEAAKMIPTQNEAISFEGE